MTRILRSFIVAIAIVLVASSAYSRRLEIGPGKEFAGLEAAAAVAQPGDTIVYTTGVHAGGAYVANLHGTDDRRITIMGDGKNGSIIRGGNSAFQLTDPRYVNIVGLVFEGQTSNGVNIDDGGTPESPAHHILFEDCEWRGINATGNNDLLKLSGVDQFAVMNCKFSNGAAGGSLVDMVGCHRGEFTECLFENAGSNCIQAKGATQYIWIQRNKFLNGGQRAINIGGSTGLEFFRPLGADYEASDIYVWSNVFVGGVASVAFVGSINSEVINNTIIRPERWAIRILQESVDGFQPCGNNRFINNIVVFNSTQPAINIGGNTAPETFTFSHNLWYNPDNDSWPGPNTPVAEPGRILNQDPKLDELNYFLASNSPAKFAGLKVTYPEEDYYDRSFADPRSIGGVEFSQAGVAGDHETEWLSIYPNPVSSMLTVASLRSTPSHIAILDLLGRTMVQSNIEASLTIDVSTWAPGIYLLVMEGQTRPILKR